MLNIQEIESIQPLLSIQINGRPNNDIAGILRANNQDQNELTFIITTKTISYILRAPNNRDFNRWMYILNRMKETYIELEDEMNNPKPHIERPRFKGFPPPPNNPPPPELQAKRYRNCQEYVKNNLGFSLSIPQSAFMEVNRPLVVQVCMDIRDKFYRRIALLKIWNICFTDLLSIDTNVSHNAVIIPVNKAIMAKDGPSVPPMGDPSGPSGPGGPMGMPMGNMPMGMGGMPEGMPHGMNNMGMPQGLMSPSMGIKSGTKNDLGIPIATPGLGSPNMKGMNGPNGPMSPTMVPGMGAPMGVPGLMSPPMAPSGMGGVPMGLMSPKVNGNGPMDPKINGNGPMGLMSPKVNGNGPMGLMSPQVNGNGPMGLMSPKVNGNGPMMGGNMMKGTPMMDEMKPGMSPMVNGINRKDSVGSSVIEPNIKELMNYGKNDDDDSDDEFYLPKKEDGSLKPFIGRNSVIGNTNSLLHFKKLSLMDVGGDFNSLYRALNNENAHNNQIPKQKSQKQGSTDHFAQELEMLDNMNTKSSQQANMNKMGINTRQVNMTNIVPGVSKTTSMIQPNDESMMTEDISVDFPAPPNPYGQTTLGILNSRNDRNMQEQNMGNMGMMPAQAPVPAEKIHIPVDPELLHCLTAMLRIIHRLSGSCFREEQKSFESVPPPVPKWYYQFCVKSFPSFAKLSQTHVINYLECMEEQYAINGHQELPQEYLKIQEALESFIKATRAWERVVNDWKRDIIHRKHLNHKKINFDDDDSIMKVVRINDVLRVNLLLKDHIEENARRETSKLRKFFQPPQRKSIEKNK
ncbi:hypothetical protein PIROE2DRAFT_69389 [Piromyces sp. E2]|nr:hypothetical protein PIROE2DRAFT_69389 [Piromyces sp. E2]|eukprot:OUM63339.1 hypothetical protein PIROE2DRAFT_69389 [Piromyces sp. E2]